MNITKALLPTLSAALALTLVACGSSDDASGSDSASGVLASTEVEGAGNVFTDEDGRAVYFADEEESGDVLCVDACLAIWDPVVASASDAQGDFGTLTRPDDGKTQLTWNGAPVYTFKLEEAGQVTGELTDVFDGTSFTWHVARTDGTTPSQAPEDSQDDLPDYGY